MIDFRNTLERCQLSEIRFCGPRFTWDNRRLEDEFIQERLDYAFANEPWLERFPGAVVNHLCRQGSDHIPLMIYRLRVEVGQDKRRTGVRPSRFETLWAEHEGCEAVVDNAWKNPSSFG